MIERLIDINKQIQRGHIYDRQMIGMDRRMDNRKMIGREMMETDRWMIDRIDIQMIDKQIQMIYDKQMIEIDELARQIIEIHDSKIDNK